MRDWKQEVVEKGLNWAEVQVHYSSMLVIERFSKGENELDGKKVWIDDEGYYEDILAQAVEIEEAKVSGRPAQVESDRVQKYVEMVTGKPVVMGKIESSVGDVFDEVLDDLEDDEDGWDGWDSEDSGELEDSEEATGELEVEDGGGEESEGEEDEPEETSGINKEKLEKISKYYQRQIAQAVNELEKKCAGMYESGYEVLKPVGMVTSEGLISLSGSEKIVKEFDSAIQTIYRILRDKIGFVEMVERSNSKIAERVYFEYTSGERKLLYFPNKHLEFAFGRVKPDGDMQESLKTFPKHSKSANWSEYAKSEVQGSLKNVFTCSILKFADGRSNDGIELFSEQMDLEVAEYVEYLKRCLAFSMLMVIYKTTDDGGIDSFKLRVCDTNGALGSSNIVNELLEKAFAGGTGKDPFSYKPRIDFETGVKEYAHEFDHSAAQGMPLFAYKAYLALKEQGMQLDINTLILGMLEDGTILRNGKDEFNLAKTLLHFINAGSRAGKGVMTLNILMAILASGIPLFYLDRKPDMASILKQLFPEMFIVNGASLNQADDKYNQFIGINSKVDWSKVPDYVGEVFGTKKTWEEMGDLFYCRALKLICGIILARAKGYAMSELGGERGICVVVDEFTNFQDNFSALLKKAHDLMAPITYEADMVKLHESNMQKSEKIQFEAKCKTSYNEATMYATAWVKSLAKDLELVETMRNAGFAEAEVGMSNIFIIGQNIERGPIQRGKLTILSSDGTGSARYGRAGLTGTLRSGLDKIDWTRESYPMSLISMKTADIMMGNNEPKPHYMAQEDVRSKAKGRLDRVANNFAYINSFDESMRQKIINIGNTSETIEIAGKAVYFKPFLVLNNADMDSSYVRDMFDRCAKANVGRAEIINDNLGEVYTDANGEQVKTLHKGVGFDGYLKLVGAEGLQAITGESSRIANTVVARLGYKGTWFEFITDLRPDWLFTVEDIVNALGGNEVALRDPSTNPVTREMYRFDRGMFSVESVASFEDGYVEEEDEEFNDYSSAGEGERPEMSIEDYGDLMGVKTRVDADMAGVFNDGGASENINFFTEPIRDGLVVDKSLEDALALLRARGFQVSSSDGESLEEDFEGGLAEDYADDFEVTEFNENSVIEGQEIESLVKLVTMDALEKFGGLGNIVSLKVVGGTLFLNGYAYRCSLSSDLRKRLSYDLRREIMTGNVCRLFDYGCILEMPRLRDLEFDSASFVYDYVSIACGYGSILEPGMFFRDCQALQSLKIAGRLWGRDSENLESDEVFAKAKRSTQIADASEHLMSKACGKSWNFSKEIIKKKDYGNFVRVGGFLLGATAAGVAGGAFVGSKVGRGLFRGGKKFVGGLKDLWSESKEF